MAEQLSGHRYDYQEPMSLKNLQYHPIGRHSDWLKEVARPGTSIQSALFYNSIIM